MQEMWVTQLVAFNVSVINRLLSLSLVSLSLSLSLCLSFYLLLSQIAYLLKIGYKQKSHAQQPRLILKATGLEDTS